MILTFNHTGRRFVTYSSSTNLLTLHTSPPATLQVASVTSLFALPPPSHSDPHRTLIGITASYTVVAIHAVISGPTPALSLLSESTLPLPAPPKMILPVDPMAWVGQYGMGTRGVAQAHDVLLSVSEDGELAFWVPEGGLGDRSDPAANGKVNGARGREGQKVSWRCTGKVRTGRKGLSMARCSSAKKSVLGKHNIPRRRISLAQKNTHIHEQSCLVLMALS